MNAQQIHAEIKEAIENRCEQFLNPAAELWLADWIAGAGNDGVTARIDLIAADGSLLDDLLGKIDEIGGATICDLVAKSHPGLAGSVSVPVLKIFEVILSEAQTILCTKAAA